MFAPTTVSKFPSRYMCHSGVSHQMRFCMSEIHLFPVLLLESFAPPSPHVCLRFTPPQPIQIHSSEKSSLLSDHLLNYSLHLVTILQYYQLFTEEKAKAERCLSCCWNHSLVKRFRLRLLAPDPSPSFSSAYSYHFVD